jgi:hypothetical protein
MELPHSSTAIWVQMENDFAAERVALPFLYRCLPFRYWGPKNETHRRKAFKRLQERLIISGTISRTRLALSLTLSCGVSLWFFTRSSGPFTGLTGALFPLAVALPPIVSSMITNSFGRIVFRYLGENPVITSNATLAS